MPNFCRRKIKQNSPFIGKKSCSIPLRQYRSLQVLARITNTCIGTIFPYAIMACCCVSIAMLSTLVKFFNKVSFGVSFNFGMGSFFCLLALKESLHGGGELLTHSTELKRQLSLQSKQDPYMLRYLRSLQAMQMCAGTYFYVKSGTFLTSTKFILDQVITILLSL